MSSHVKSRGKLTCVDAFYVLQALLILFPHWTLTQFAVKHRTWIPDRIRVDWREKTRSKGKFFNHTWLFNKSWHQQLLHQRLWTIWRKFIFSREKRSFCCWDFYKWTLNFFKSFPHRIRVEQALALFHEHLILNCDGTKAFETIMLNLCSQEAFDEQLVLPISRIMKTVFRKQNELWTID